MKYFLFIKLFLNYLFKAKSKNKKTMNVSQMSEQEQISLTSIHQSIFPKRKKGFEKLSFSYFNNAKSKYDNITQPVLSMTKHVLESLNITNYDFSAWFMEFQQRNCGFEKKVKRTFDWHRDDYATIGYKVHTIIFYLRKDKTIKGGNLEYEIDDKKYIQEIESGDVLCFNGDLKHRPEICSGMGCRDSIVVFVKRRKRKI